MANQTMMSYIKRDSVIHRLTGTTKFIVFLLFSAAGMITYDTRILLGMLAFSVIVFFLGKIKLAEVKLVLMVMGIFLLLNSFFIYLFAPEQGVLIYGSRTVIWEGIGRYTITVEQLFYLLNVCLKYFVALPMAILFISTTNPSEFASSLNRIGVSYRIGYAISLALRYIPDVQRDFREISQAQQARGIELGREVPISKKLKNIVNILLPLVLSSLERIEVVSSAMELRGFGKNKTRTWYIQRPFFLSDYIAMGLGGLIFLISLVVAIWNGSRYFNPFL
ncbi:MAG: energy-coupling factor transporter transmembrane component T [Eubacteriales bacterium]